MSIFDTKREYQVATGMKERDFYYRGVRLQMTGQLREAIAAYTEALRLNPSHSSAYISRGCAYDDLGLFDEALGDFTAAIALEPRHADGFYNRGLVYDHLKRRDQAIADYTQAISLNPNHADAFHNRGNDYFHRKHYDQAVADYTQAVRLNPNYASTWNNRGIAYSHLGRYDLAVQDFITMTGLQYPGEDPQELAALIPRDRPDAGEEHIQKLLSAGFYIDINGNPQEAVIINPHHRSDRIVLFFSNLHVGKTICRRLNQYRSRYELRFDTDFDAVMKRCVAIHGDIGLTSAFQYYLSKLRDTGGPARSRSFALYQDGALAAGEIGVSIGRIYTSYTGYHDVSSAGTAQLILTARYLEEREYAFWDFGPGGHSYKIRMGARELSWDRFKGLFQRFSGGSGDPVHSKLSPIA